jgi:acid phosphatase family membrane protein YuiD
VDGFLGIFNNKALMTAVLGWCVAQILKMLIGLLKEKRISLTLLLSSGGMPSSHSATVCALTTSVGYDCGFTSSIFAVSFILAFIVMYDASGVRRAAGEQAKILNRLMRDIEEGRTEDMQKGLKELIGHTPVEVLAGAVLGVALAVLTNI